MRSKLKGEGSKIESPVSVAAAKFRQGQLLAEAEKIEEQLEDFSRIARFGSELAYNAWRRSARKAAASFYEEARQLELWLQKVREHFELQGVELLRRAGDALRQVELRHPLTKQEQEVADEVEAFFADAEE